MSKKVSKQKIRISGQNQKLSEKPGLNSYKRYVEFLLILLLVFITYGNSIQNDYNLDDGYVVSLDNANLLTSKGISGIPEILTSKYSEGEGVTYGYRPFGKVTMAIEYSIWQNNPHLSHFVNLLLFAINVYLLLLFFKRIATMFNIENSALVYLPILFYIVHPIHTEVVCSIKNREEILCFSFLLAALLIYFKFNEQKKWWYLVPFLVFTMLAFFSKETAFNIFGILLLLIFFKIFVLVESRFKLVEGFKNAISVRSAILLFIAFISYFTFSKTASSLPFGDIGFHFEQNPYHFFPAIHSIPNGIQTLFFYVSKLILPFPLLFYYGYDMLPLQYWNSITTYIGVLVALLILAFIFYGIFKRKYLYLIFWILFFFGTLLPFSNLIYDLNVTGIVGERLTYQASAGFCVMLSIAIVKIAELVKLRFNKMKQHTSYYLSLIIVIPFLIVTVFRNSQWQNKETLFQHDIPYLSKSARANYMFAGNIMNDVNSNSVNTFQKEALIYKAVYYMNNALKVYPKYDEAYLGLGNIYASYLSSSDSAIYYFSKVDTSNILVYSKTLEAIGDIFYYDSSSVTKAIEYYRTSLNKYAQNRKLYNKLTQLLYRNNMFNDLFQLGQKGAANNWPEGFINIGDYYINKGDTATAINNYQFAVDLGFREPRLLRNMTYYYKSRGMLDKLNRLPR
jgi:hypothetical protein